MKGLGTASEQHPIRVLIRDEDIGDISAHSWMHIAPEGTDDAEGHGWKFEVGKAQGGRGPGLRDECAPRGPGQPRQLS